MAAMKFPQSHAVVNIWMGCGLLGMFAGVSADSDAFAGRGPAAALPVCLPPVVMTNVQVRRVEGNGNLTLVGGQVVRLESLLWPRKDDGAPNWLLSRTVASLRDLARGKLNLRMSSPKLDRYGRLRAQVASDAKWLQREILVRGLARVAIAPDRRECASPLYAAEAEARQAGAGLWAISAYRVRKPESLRWQDLGLFQIVEGGVLSARVTGGRAYLNFGRDWRTDFTATISPQDMKSFRHAAIDPYRYAGKSIRVRGYIERMNGFEIEVPSPETIEVIRK